MATLKKRIEDLQEFTNPNVVKVVTDGQGNAIYFSRSPIPYDLSGQAVTSSTLACTSTGGSFFFLTPGFRSGRSSGRSVWKQLRALENGYTIRVAETEYESLGVDTPDDLKRVEKIYNDLYGKR